MENRGACELPRGPAGVAGRVDQLVLPIPVGARFALRVDLRNYWAPVTEEFEIKLERGDCIRSKRSSQAKALAMTTLIWT